MTDFHIRTTAVSEDATFILEAFDSSLPHLASIGSGEQWGLELRSKQEIIVNRTNAEVEKARSGISDNDAVFVAEIPWDDPVAESTRVRRDENDQQMLKVAAAVVHGEFPWYVGERENLKARVHEALDRADFLYLSIMVSDFRAGDARKGAGAVLAQRVKNYAREKGKNAVFCDCWVGNGGKLIEFYHSQGFESVDGFEVKRTDTVWPGMLLRMDIDQNKLK
ncbi:hypothetical protein E2P81_ATG04689 [Venturia nashicola]|uniref:N-acetyltransferase domain-containing protein n=1 Tax=Venturia nashicola TaxID=86259 RepID=A0A4Z1NZ45_9PEZI|nr:hypothetical protein E6O75_ATG04797 [Venturia nashicola]TLD34524.1 hypothetical protein E2P81_ATG04689 [Venturia nashicola]